MFRSSSAPSLNASVFLRFYSTHSLSAKVLQAMSKCEQLSPTERGYQFIINSCNARHCFQPIVSSSPEFTDAAKTPFPEIFDTVLVSDLIGEKDYCPTTCTAATNYISNNQRENKHFGFFEDSSLLPDDVDDTALAWLVLLKNKRRTLKDVESVVDEILANIDEKGRIQTYFPPRHGRESRVDPTVCANALRLIHLLERGAECKPTEDYLYEYLQSFTHLRSDENLYYGNQTFFYFLGEALKSSPSLKKKFEPLFVDKVRACIATSSKPIDLATRVILSTEWDFPNQMEVERLTCLQCQDGSWPIDIAYTGSRKNLYWGSNVISTAFALRALDHKKVISQRKETLSLPLFDLGFKLNDGHLKYSEGFHALDLNYKMVAITHTETYSALNSRFYDQNPDSANNGLTKKGKKDAWSIGYHLRAEFKNKPVLILHGDNTRTFQTAQALYTHLPHAHLESAPWLSEIHCGEWLGKDTQAVLEKNLSASSMFLDSNCLAQPKGGENFLNFLTKIYLGLKELKKRSIPRETTILFCTSRVNLVALKILTQQDVIYSSTHIDWGKMAHEVKPGTIFRPK